jgi:LysR family transcriptional regulator, low CO2-responsive transcriptional regulator
VHGFPQMLNWYLVSRRNKRLPPVAQAFREFLLREGESLLARVVPLPRSVSQPKRASAGAGHTPRRRTPA